MSEPEVAQRYAVPTPFASELALAYEPAVEGLKLVRLPRRALPAYR